MVLTAPAQQRRDTDTSSLQAGVVQGGCVQGSSTKNTGLPILSHCSESPLTFDTGWPSSLMYANSGMRGTEGQRACLLPIARQNPLTRPVGHALLTREVRVMKTERGLVRQHGAGAAVYGCVRACASVVRVCLCVGRWGCAVQGRWFQKSAARSVGLLIVDNPDLKSTNIITTKTDRYHSCNYE